MAIYLNHNHMTRNKHKELEEPPNLSHIKDNILVIDNN